MRRKLSWRVYTSVAGISLVVAAIACGPQVKTGNPDPTAQLVGEVQASSVPGTSMPTNGGEAAVAATTAAPPTATSTLPCNYDSVYVADVTVPDGMEVIAGTGFTKTWRIQNNGCLPWPDGTMLLFVEGAQMGGPISVPVPATAAGGTQDVSVSLTAPATAGEHKGYWQLRSADGIQFGDKIYVKINAVPPTPTPTLTPTATIGFFQLITPVIMVPLTADFTASYVESWSCSGNGRTSFKIKNTGTLDFESLEYALEGPIGTVIKSGTSNAPFRSSPSANNSSCLSKGGGKLAVDATAYLWLGETVSLPGINGQATIKLCGLDDLGGFCKTVTVVFVY